MFAESAVPHWDFPRNTGSVALLAEFGVERGLSVERVLAGSGISVTDLRAPDTTVSARQELTVADNLVRLLGDPPGLGFDVGVRYRVGTFGIFGYACLTSPTLGDAARFALRYYELTFGYCLPRVTISGDTATLAVDLPELTGSVAEFLVQRDLAAIATVIADLLGAPLPLRQVTFTFERRDPDDGNSTVPVVLGTEPAYGQPANAVTFAADMLGQPLPQASPMTVALCEEQCRALLTRHRARTGIAQQVREQLVRIDGGPHTVSTVAKSLAMSERTLRRRLTEENTSFRSLAEEVHVTLAREMLATRALSVDDVAIRLGYSEASSFIAAFKRWTGTTPARYQRTSGSATR